MPLKVQINGKKFNATRTGISPVTFINGQKKRLSKGVTFINGQKKIVWDVHGLQIDYVALGMDAAYPVYATNDRVVICTASGYVNRYNISNISAPTLENSVQMGIVCSFSSIDSTDSKVVFYAYNNTSKYCQQINISLDALSITGEKKINWTPSPEIKMCGLINSSYLCQTGITELTFYYNNNKSYSYSYNVGTNVYIQSRFVRFAKLNSTTFVGTYVRARQAGLATYTSSGYTERITDQSYDSIMIDGENIVCAGDTGFSIYNNSFSRIAHSEFNKINKKYALVGRIRDFYYVVEYPYGSGAPDKDIILHIFQSNGNIYQSYPLDISAPSYIPPENAVTTGHEIIRVLPYVSQNGVLSFIYTGKLGNNYDVNEQGATAIIIRGY